MRQKRLPIRLGPMLTRREREVRKLVLEALSDKEITAKMGISWHTVRFHVSNIFRKYGVSTRTQLFLVSMTKGDIDP